MPADGDRFDRRNMLKYLGVASAAGLAGCTDGGSGNDTTTDGEGGQETTTTSGGGETTEEASRQVKGTYRGAVSSDAKTLNFIQHSDETSGSFVDACLDGAYSFKGVGEPVPFLVKEFSDTDKQVWEFTLRDNLKWSDPYGQMTAEDWVYFIQNIHQGEDNWAGSVHRGEWMTGEEGNTPIPVEKTGKLSFKVELESPQPAYPATAMWWAKIMPKKLIEPYVEKKDKEGLQKDETINNLGYTGNLGPYTFETWERESRFVATRNEEYYLREADDLPDRFNDAPYFETYELKILKEDSTRLAALRKGNITSSEVPAPKVAQFEKMDHLKFRFPPNPYCGVAWYNQRANGWEMLREKGVRQALGYAVNKKAIAENIYRGYPDVAHTFQPEWSPWYDDSKVWTVGTGEKYSHEKAKEELKKALPNDYGYEGDKLMNPDGEQVTLTFAYRGGSQTNQTVAEYFKQEYSNIGIRVEPTNAGPFNTLQKKYMVNGGSFNGGPRDESTTEEPWDILYGVSPNAYPINPDGSNVFWEQKGSFNFTGYHPSGDIAGLYETAKSATDDQTRRDAFAKVFGILSEDQPVNFLNFDVYKYAYKKEYMGMGEEMEYLSSWDSTSWYLK